MSVPAQVSPADGGCWYCFMKTSDMYCSWEYDTNVHGECIREAIVKDPRNLEALNYG